MENPHKTYILNQIILFIKNISLNKSNKLLRSERGVRRKFFANHRARLRDQSAAAERVSLRSRALEKLKMKTSNSLARSLSLLMFDWLASHHRNDVIARIDITRPRSLLPTTNRACALRALCVCVCDCRNAGLG